ncbi:unnamed protein product [Meganyctiphanes norvegica]|uniref:Uncharacterized protein n=1 Tax=Meganyctiphanes norvegica TaxID=48144 RepID=A0AAV2PNG6_MEGNR
MEPGPVDENANAIEAPVVDAPVEIPQENIKTQLQEIISEIEQQVIPEEDEEVTKEQEDAVKSLVEQELKLMQEEEAMLAQQKTQEDEVKKVMEEDVVVVNTEEAKEVEADASVMRQEELKAMEAEQAAVEEVAGDKSSSNELWNVEGVRVTMPHETEEGYYEEYDEHGQPLFHTWRPKGKYEIIKTEIKKDDINPIRVDDPKLSELAKPAPAPAPAADVTDFVNQQDGMQVDMSNGISNEMLGLSPGFDIPAGIPLLARILPKDPTEVERKISLERLFTPATDSPDLTPTRNKKVFSSSAFYRPDHPTIGDQVDLAKRISASLFNDDNKQSRGQTMYIKRKKRSVRWIHQGPGGPGLVEVSEPDSPQRTPGDRGPMKLMMSSKQEKVDQAYHTSEMDSPTGKGAALFAKRKKRMDKYVVDENTVQQSMEASSFAQQQTSVMSSSSMQSSSITQGQQMMVGGAYAGPTNITYGAPGVAAGGDVIYTAECKVVQRSHPPTPQFELPASGRLEMTAEEKHEKRKSFNLAAKGFGTYQNFYTPVHLGKAC